MNVTDKLLKEIVDLPKAGWTSLEVDLATELLSRRASLEELAKRIEEAMNEITNLPVGAIGEGGPTIDELDAHVDATGHSWDDDAEYHTGQRAWRILEQAQAIVRQYMKEVRQ